MARITKGLKTLVTGEILEKLKIDRYLIHIVIIAAALCLILLCRFVIEEVQVERERLREKVEEAKLVRDQTYIELVGLGKMSTVEEMLEENGVKVGKPAKPAKMIRR